MACISALARTDNRNALLSENAVASEAIRRSIVPDGWFEDATRKHFETGEPDRGYGYQWWTFDGGSFAAIGIHGQLIFVDAARQLVVAINSAWPVATAPERNAARKEFLQMITTAIDAEEDARRPGR